jgi:AcrR family transcriptional regulator
MRIDPLLLPVFADFDLGDGSDINAEREAAVSGARAMVGWFTEPVPSSVAIHEICIPAEPPVPARIYTPEGQRLRGGLVFAHGGGWATGSPETVNEHRGRLAADADIVVVGLDDRLVPEHRFPAGLDDVVHALTWIGPWINPMTEDRRDRRRRELWERIETAALDLFAAHGYRATTMDQIAEHADTARRTLFNHFPRKWDILDIWSDRRRDRLSTMFDDEAWANLSARERLTRQFDALATINTDDPALAKVIVVGRLTEMGALEESFPIFDAFRETVALGQEHGEFSDRVRPEIVGEVLTSCYTDTLQRWVFTGRSTNAELEDALRVKLDLILGGLGTRAEK